MHEEDREKKTKMKIRTTLKLSYEHEQSSSMVRPGRTGATDMPQPGVHQKSFNADTTLNDDDAADSVKITK